MEILFWVIIFLLAHTYVVYPWTLKGIADFFKRQQPLTPPVEWPKISLIFSAYNEESILESKIENILALDYPKDKLEVIIGSDGSKDNTDSILTRYKDQFNILIFEQNRGKAAVLNDLKDAAKGEILVFCDANTFFLKNALKVLMLPFTNNAQMGCVSGRLILNDTGKNTLGEGESLYWQIESRIKELEGQLNILMGVNGAIYAIKKELYTKIPEQKKITDDFFISVNALLKNKHCTYIRQSIGTETTSKDPMGEFHRKVRISQANFNFLKNYIALLNPLRPLIAYSFFSHKLLRWFSPHLMIVAWILNLMLLHSANYLVLILFALQNIFFILAILGWVFDKKNKRFALSSLPYYFMAMNYALLIGFFQAIFKSKGGGWERIERDA